MADESTMTVRKSRRSFLWSMALAGAGAALVHSGGIAGRAWVQAGHAATPDLVHDTFNGLLAFVVPGPDSFSVAQGVSTPEPGGVEAGATDVLIATLDETTPFLPNFSATVAAVLNGLAQAVNPAAGGPFLSPFARLSFAQKAAVFQIMDATDTLKPLAAVLPAFVAFFVYSEAGVFDPRTRSLTGQPIGWRLSSYQGVAEGRDEFLGYFKIHRDGR
jgi:hypothetical protein